MKRDMTFIAGLLAAALAITTGCMSQKAANLTQETPTIADGSSLPMMMPEVTVFAERPSLTPGVSTDTVPAAPETGAATVTPEPTADPNDSGPMMMPEVIVTAKRGPAGALTTVEQGPGSNLN